MLDYLLYSITAFLMGFVPYFEIYVAVPAAMAMGLDIVSAVVWAGFGNFMAVPLIVFFYNFLSGFPKVRNWLNKLSDNKHEKKIEKYGNLFVLVMTPLVGIWVTAVIAKSVGYSKSNLIVFSLCSIYFYGTLVGLLTLWGFDLLNL